MSLVDVITVLKEKLEVISKLEEYDAAIITDDQVEEANIFISNLALNTIEDFFLVFSSLNLLNAYNKKEYAVSKKYDFKLQVGKVIEALIYWKPEGITFSYNKNLTIIDILGLQFSFHHSEITDMMKNHKTDELKWDGLKLQRLASEIFEIAKRLDNLSNEFLFETK